jgi:ribosomal protein S18 acetylase RimI-like enzyme
VGEIAYRLGNDISVDAFVDVLRSSTLGARRPVDDADTMAKMIAGANLVVSAWDGELLVGIARSLSDFAFCTYLSDLAVRLEYQRQGIGRELIKRTQKAGRTATVFLFAAPDAIAYYERLGLTSGAGFYLTRMQRV